MKSVKLLGSKILTILKWIVIICLGGLLPIWVFCLNIFTLALEPGISTWIFGLDSPAEYQSLNFDNDEDWISLFNFMVVMFGITCNTFSIICVWVIYKLDYYNSFFKKVIRFIWYCMIPCTIVLLSLEAWPKYQGGEVFGLSILICLNILCVACFISAYNNNYYKFK